jgi:spermidine synthase
VRIAARTKNTTMSDCIAEVSESDARTVYPITRRIWDGATRTCSSVILAESDTYGRMLFLEGELQSAAADEHVYHESLVHPVMASLLAANVTRSGDLRVLVVGGGEGATVREVLRWSQVGHVDWVDIDGELVELCETHLGWAPGVRTDERVAYYAEDIQEMLPMLGKYDVIILDLPDPDGDTGYLYSTEFWGDMYDHLEETGRIVTHVGPARPFGGVGEGFQRVRDGLAAACMWPHPGGFYSVGIPSFQGQWGFWIWAHEANPFVAIRERSAEGRVVLPTGLRCVDDIQLVQWAVPTRMWRDALGPMPTRRESRVSVVSQETQ